MITEIRIANFYSIGEQQTISFLKTGKTPEKGYTQIKQGKSSVTNSSVSLIDGFFGPNASGKTNILRAITTLVAMMYNVPVPNLIYDPSKSKHGILRNFKNEFKDQPTKLGADFLFSDNLYSYDIEFLENGDILKESLNVKQNQSNLNSSSKKIYTRHESGEVKLGPDYEDLEQYLKISTLSKDQSLFALSLLQGFSFTLDFKNQILMWNLGNLDNVPQIVKIMNAGVQMKLNAEWIKLNALEITISTLKLFNPKIKNIHIETKDNITIKVEYHNFDEFVDIQNESAGTQELFVYIFQIIQVLRKGGVVIYDEINRLWHPDIQKAIFSLFLQNSSENSRAQLIFSSHDHEIMNNLELDQINLVEKEGDSTQTYKLSEVEGVEKRDNVSKKYRLGIYGAIPDMIDFNYGLNELI